MLVEKLGTDCLIRDQGQAPSERLAARILTLEGFTSIDPSHPLGGPDGGRDIVCIRSDKKFVAACYFPRGQQTNTSILKKFRSDVEIAGIHKPDGIVFFTNQ